MVNGIRTVRVAPAGNIAKVWPATVAAELAFRPTVTVMTDCGSMVPVRLVTRRFNVRSFGPPNHDETDSGTSSEDASFTGTTVGTGTEMGRYGAPTLWMGILLD